MTLTFAGLGGNRAELPLAIGFHGDGQLAVWQPPIGAVFLQVVTYDGLPVRRLSVCIITTRSVSEGPRAA